MASRISPPSLDRFHRSPSRWGAIAFAAGLLASLVSLGAAEPAPAAASAKAVKLPPFIVNERPLPIEMPPFVVTESKFTKPWRYAEADGFEVLAQCDDAAAQEVFAGLWRGPRLTLPPPLRPQNATPMAVVIFDQEPSSGGAAESTSFVNGHYTNEIKRTLQDREVFCLNLFRHNFRHASTFRFDLRTLFALHTPAAPSWLQEALHGPFGIYERVYHADGSDEMELNRNLWVSAPETVQVRAQLDAAVQRSQLSPEARHGALAGPSPLAGLIPALADLWGEPTGNATFANDRRRWAATAALFARWAMFAEQGRRYDAFWRFATEAFTRPVNEDFFRECFGLGYEEVRIELAWYLPIATNEPAVRRITPLQPPVLKFRPASRAEIARVRGEFERGEALTLAERYPAIAAKYREQLDRTVRGASAAEPADPRLAALFGLHEFESGHPAAARALLETATAGGSARPRAWLALAFLRFSDASAAPAGADGLLDPAQTTAVLAPLTRAFGLQPAMTESYELLAEVWRTAPSLAADETIARLTDGQRAFPRNIRLTLAASRAAFERGHRGEAIAFIDRSLPFATDPAAKDRLEKVRAALLTAPAVKPL